MRGGQRAPMAPSQENWGLARVGWRGCCGGRVPSFLEQKQPPPPTLRRRRGPARGQVPSRALKITAGN